MHADVGITKIACSRNRPDAVVFFEGHSGNTHVPVSDRVSQRRKLRHIKKCRRNANAFANVSSPLFRRSFYLDCLNSIAITILPLRVAISKSRSINDIAYCYFRIFESLLLAKVCSSARCRKHLWIFYACVYVKQEWNFISVIMRDTTISENDVWNQSEITK